ncbi:MAG: alpha/beta hydrolase [Actinoplanes sp.]
MTEPEVLTADGGPSGTVSLRLIRPAVVAEMPVVLYLPGYHQPVRDLAAPAGAAEVVVGYRRPPGVRYPVAIEECYAALEWIAAHGARHGLDPDRIAVAGDEEGGNLAAAVTLMAKQRSGPALAAQLLFAPITDATDGRGRRFWDEYAPDPAVRTEITASPLRATTEQLAGLPPALIIVAEADARRDEGEAYAAKLRSAGVPVTAVRYLGTSLRDTCAAHAATAQGGRFLFDALHQEENS